MIVPKLRERFASLVVGFGDRLSGPPIDTVRLRQVHGRRVRLCDDLSGGEHPDIEADALVATRPNVFVAVKTADCVPILLLAPPQSGCWVAAVHAGWRGTEADVVGGAVADAVARGHDPRTLMAAVGPAIGLCCYEVNEDVAARFRRAGFSVPSTEPKPRLDLAALNRELLLRAGLRPEHVEVVGPCTRCEAQRYHSYRAAPGEMGRQLSWIGWRD